MIKTNLLILFTLLFLLACQTPQHKGVQEITTGMDKWQVLDAAGSPKFTKSDGFKDTWRYVFYKDNIKMSKDILFYKDHVVKVKKTIAKPELLDHAMSSDDMLEYEARIKKFKEAQNLVN